MDLSGFDLTEVPCNGYRTESWTTYLFDFDFYDNDPKGEVYRIIRSLIAGGMDMWPFHVSGVSAASPPASVGNPAQAQIVAILWPTLRERNRAPPHQENQPPGKSTYPPWVAPAPQSPPAFQGGSAPLPPRPPGPGATGANDGGGPEMGGGGGLRCQDAK